MSELRQIGEQAFHEGRNVTKALREHLGTDKNTPEAIEVAYDLQAGSYVAFADENPGRVGAYAQQLAEFLDPHLKPDDILLDAGTGEMTNLTHMVLALETPLASVHGTDISKPRIDIGRQYAERHGVNVCGIRAELSSLPFPNSSIDVVTTNHALEPNGGREIEILAELLRVARRKLVLFEPCYELASDEARARMREHGYVRDLRRHAERLGAAVESVTPLDMIHNPLNPTACFVITKRPGTFSKILGAVVVVALLAFIALAITSALDA